MVRGNGSNTILVALLLFVMVIVLVTSSFFYFSAISGTGSVSSKVIYDLPSESESLNAVSELNSSVMNSSENK